MTEALTSLNLSRMALDAVLCGIVGSAGFVLISQYCSAKAQQWIKGD